MTGDAASPIEPALTVGIPAYNAGKSLDAAIRSILRQTWCGTIEILVVDDGSTDDTVAVATRLAQEYGAVRVVRHDRNRGRPTARNTILREARGRYLTWMDADDEWYPNKLALQFDRLFAHEATSTEAAARAVICMCAFDWKWAHAGHPSHRLPDITGDQLKGLLNGRIGAYLWTMLGTLEAFRDVGDFDEKLPRLQDLDFTIRFVARGGHLIMSDPRIPLCLYHKDDDGRPGRVIAESMAHIRRKHRPLFLQYGPRFLRGARRQHYLLVSRHGHRNEGRWYGLRYALLASLVAPGRILSAVLRVAGLKAAEPVSKPAKPETLRERLPDLKERARNGGGPARVDLVVMTAEFGMEDLRSHFRLLGHEARQAGLWYLPTSAVLGDGRRRDHGDLYDLLRADDPRGRQAAARLARMAAICNGDGQSSVLFLGSPIDLDRRPVDSIEIQVRELRAALATIAAEMRPAGVRLHVHLIVPDSETLLWRRHALALQTGQAEDFDSWLRAQPESLARLLDLRVLEPLGAPGAVEGVECLHLHLLGEGGTLEGLRRAFLRTFRRPPAWPDAAPAMLGAPTRHAGLPLFERLLRRYGLVLGTDGQAAARRRFWMMPTHGTTAAPSAQSLQWLRNHGHWLAPAQRFPAARLQVVAAQTEPRYAPEHFRYPVEAPADYDRSLAEWRLLQSLASP